MRISAILLILLITPLFAGDEQSQNKTNKEDYNGQFLGKRTNKSFLSDVNSTIDDATPIRYISFQNDTLMLYPWWGEYIVVLSASNSLDPSTMLNLINILDSSYSFLKTMTGREPIKYSPTYINNRSTIAAVPRTCGAGCGYVGYTGFEMLQTSGYMLLDTLYLDYKNNETFFSLPFWEFGRNYWFYGDYLEYKDIAAGQIGNFYSKLLSFVLSSATGVKRTPGDSLEASKLNKLMETYENNPQYNWENSIYNFTTPIIDGTDRLTLLAGMFLRLMTDYGGQQFLFNFWQEVIKRPKAQTTQDAVDNFILCACAGAKLNIVNQFKISWKWPVSDDAIQEAFAKWGNPQSITNNIKNYTFNLFQNYPNPFNPNTVISYSLPSASDVRLVVFNSLGQTVKVLENGFKNLGNYSISFNASDLSSGIYFYKLEAGQFSQAKKMMVIK